MNLAKTYEPQAYEGEIYELWLNSGAFTPSGDGEPFALIMPPPNANAALHIGTSTYVKQDAKSRYRRLMGDRVLYLPGADHAGFETWYMYEKELAKQGKSKFDFTDKELYSMTWDFVMENIHLAKLAYKQLGLSCSWDHFTYTLDDRIVENVNKVFKKMWEEGLIYRGKRLVNYCTYHQTSFSDIEVEYEDRSSKLYYIKYGPFELATTRPETIFGDVAVAVHPEDGQYADLVGKELEIEGPVGPFKVRVVADEIVDRSFGTGVLKITPAHDFDDWEVGERHDLPLIEVITKEGKLNEKAGKFEGMVIEEAREAVAEALDKKGLLIRVDENYTNRASVCYKCHTVIEPLLMEQWFVSMKPLAKKAIEAIEAEKIKFRPANRKQIGLDYLSKIKDWNISRQCPWGIRIPAFYNEELDDWIYSEADEDEITHNGKTYVRDRDTFDTWMSSSQFPYLALGYNAENPEKSSKEFKEFFPTSWLHLGREIFTQWGLRMIMMALYNVEDIPFKTLYVNGNIRGEDGKKMSKSLGNNVAAVEILDEFGSDAMRIGMISIDNSAGSDKAFDRSKLVAGRNFANKLWNIARYIENILDEHKLNIADLGKPELKSAADNWIVREINLANRAIQKAMDGDEFAEAYSAVYDVVWNKFADWYIEVSKQDLNLSVLGWSLETILKLTHPFAPFITETIWQSLGIRGKESMLITEVWPERIKFNDGQALSFDEVIKATDFARKVKAYVGAEIEVSAENDDLAELSKKLAKLKGSVDGVILSESLNIAKLEGWSLMISKENLEKYRTEIGKRVDEVQAKIKNLENRLGNDAYVANAPEKLVNESREELFKLKEELRELKRE
jgi:valyl-tRNA synthetase